jgi:hypothetical protein
MTFEDIEEWHDLEGEGDIIELNPASEDYEAEKTALEALGYTKTVVHKRLVR